MPAWRAGAAPGHIDKLLASGSQPARILHEIGDRCPLIAGLFPGQAQRAARATGVFPRSLDRRLYGRIPVRRRGGGSAMSTPHSSVARPVELRQLSGDWPGLDALARHARDAPPVAGRFTVRCCSTRRQGCSDTLRRRHGR